MNPYESGNASLYHSFRPTPPPALVKEIVSLLSEKVSTPFSLAVDVGCGSGQMTTLLAPHFEKVIGFDSSLSQIKSANENNDKPNVSFKVSPAETIDVPDGSVDVVIACEAIHWFEIETFYEEVDRILKPNGILAVTGYTYPEPLINSTRCIHSSELIENWFQEHRDLWPKQHDLLLNRYKDLHLPYEFNKRVDPIPSDTDATLAHLIGHVRTRSGIQQLTKANPEQASLIVGKLQTDILNYFCRQESKPEEIKMIIRFNYFLIMTRKPGC